MTEDRKEQRDAELEFKNTFFNLLKDAGREASIDENGYIVLKPRLIEHPNSNNYNKEN